VTIIRWQKKKQKEKRDEPFYDILPGLMETNGIAR
jgi:hypothetical protein